MHSKLSRRSGSAFFVALLSATLLGTPASATPGLFGSQDATYDGVYRQSLVIAGLRAAKVAVPASATRWLNSQQCPDGGFEAFRADATKACSPADPATWSGEDTNSTAAAALAFVALGDTARARRAIGYLRSTQNADGGIPYYKSGASDANSTAMAMLALRASGVKPASVHRGDYTLVDFLITTAVGCEGDAAMRGGLAYMPAKPNVASDMASAQALAAMAPTVPWLHRIPATKRAASTPSVRCPGALSDDEARLRDILSGYTARRLAANASLIPNAFGAGTDVTSSAWALIGLAGADRAGDQQAATDAAIRAAAKGYVFDADGKANAGRAGILLLTAVTRGEKPTAFGGIDLVATALGTLGS